MRKIPFFLIKRLTKYLVDCIYSIYTVMTHKDFKIHKRKFEADGKSGEFEKEQTMNEPKGFAATKALIFIIVLVLIVFFFIG